MNPSAKFLQGTLFCATTSALMLLLSGCTTGLTSSAAPAPIATLAPTRIVKHATDISQVAFSNDGALMLTGDSGGRICVWQTTGPRYLRRLEGHHDTILDLAFTSQPDFAASCADLGDGTLRLWNVKSGKCLRTLPSGSSMDAFLNLAANPKNPLVAASSYKPHITLFHLPTGNEKRRLHLQSGPTRVLGFRSSGEVVAAAIDAGSIHIKGSLPEGGERVIDLPGDAGLMEAVYCADSDRLVVVDLEGNNWYWADLSAAAPPLRMESQSNPVYEIVFAKDGSLFGITSRTGVELFRPGISRAAARFDSNAGKLGIDDDGKRIAVPGFDGVRVYETDYWNEVAHVATPFRTTSAGFASHRMLAVWDASGGLATCAVP